jgi:hypothetical protein
MNFVLQVVCLLLLKQTCIVFHSWLQSSFWDGVYNFFYCFKKILKTWYKNWGLKTINVHVNFLSKSRSILWKQNKTFEVKILLKIIVTFMLVNCVQTCFPFFIEKYVCVSNFSSFSFSSPFERLYCSESLEELPISKFSTIIRETIHYQCFSLFLSSCLTFSHN